MERAICTVSNAPLAIVWKQKSSSFDYACFRPTQKTPIGMNRRRVTNSKRPDFRLGLIQRQSKNTNPHAAHHLQKWLHCRVAIDKRERPGSPHSDTSCPRWANALSSGDCPRGAGRTSVYPSEDENLASTTLAVWLARFGEEFLTVRASLGRRPCEEIEDSLPDGRHARLWRRSPNSFFSVPLL
jgi:hypothetical protein